MSEIEHENINFNHSQLNDMNTHNEIGFFKKDGEAEMNIEVENISKMIENVDNDLGKRSDKGDDSSKHDEEMNKIHEDTCFGTEEAVIEEIDLKDDANKTVTNNKTLINEVIAPKRISEYYSQFNASWKDRLKAKQLKEDSYSLRVDTFSETIYSDGDISDNDTISETPPSSKIRPLCVDSSCNSASDEMVPQLSIKSDTFGYDNIFSKIPKSASQKPLCVDSSCNSASDKIIFRIKSNSKTTASASFGCDFDCEEEIFTEEPKSVTRKPLCVESSCNSASDVLVVPASNNPSHITAIHSFGSDNGTKKMTTTSTTTTDNTDNTPTSFSTQIDETYNSLEEKILPFVKSPHTIELRLKGRLSIFQRACVKQIATQHKLLIKYFGKGRDGYVLLRKKVEMVTAQKLFLEMKRNEIERKKGKIAQDKAKTERLLNPPKTVSSGCQADFPDAKDEITELSKKAARKNRKKEWEAKQKQLAKRNSSTQTVEKGFYLCPYCECDIPESHQSLHYPFCLSKYRSQQQSAAKSGSGGTKDRKSVVVRSMRPMSGERKHRSKSRDKIQNSTIDTLRKELDKIHSNDINSMVNVLNELNKRCSVTGCSKKKQKTCEDCTVGYCNNHYSPGGNTATGHFNCPVALERAETEKQKKLGSNNPLMKTMEELSAPKFPDGVLLKKPKRVRLVVPMPVVEPAGDNNGVSTVVPTSAGNTLPPNINQTRTRNGPMLSYERNDLQKKLRERIGHLSDRRTK